MKLGSRPVRLKAIWLLLVPFFFLARPRPPLLAMGGALAALGAGVRAWSAGCIRKDRELATGGPYAHTRNPLYAGSFLMGVGVTMAGGRPFFLGLFLLFFWVVYRRTMKAEERLLEEAFGEAYRHYRDHVPALVPRLTPYRAPKPARVAGGGAAGEAEPRARGFSLARYLRNNEWEAGLGLLAGFGFLVAKMLWTS